MGAKRKSAVLAALLLGAALTLGATPSPSPSPSPAPRSDADFLALPSFELEPITEAESPETSTVRVGDILKFRIAGAPADTTLAIPEGSGETLLDQGWQLGPDNTAVPIKPGQLTLPSLALHDKEGKVVGRTNPFQVNVASAIDKNDPKPQEPAPPRGPVSLAFPWWVVAVATVVALLLVAGILFALRKWKPRPIPAPIPAPAPLPPRPADEIALEALAAIQAQGLMAKGRAKQHYFGISETLKAYLGTRYRFDALECTTSELIGFLEKRKTIPEKSLDEIEDLFQELDVVKFTDHIPAAEDGARVLERARQVVLSTRLRQEGE